MGKIMKIERYSFGEMIIDDRFYTKDLKIIKGCIVDSWWRKDGHSLCLSDIDDILQENPERIIIGCGYSGFLKVPPLLIAGLQKKGISLIDVPTQKAVEMFNSAGDLKKAAFGFHLTC